MPRISQIVKNESFFQKMFNLRMQSRALRITEEDEDSCESEKDRLMYTLLNATKARRYWTRSNYRKPSYRQFEEDLDDEGTEEQGPWLNDTEFLHKYRMSRDCFWHIVEQIDEHPVFKKALPGVHQRGRGQCLPEHQLMVLLRYLGSGGAPNKSLRHDFKISSGTAEKYKGRARKAILSLRNTAISWPDQDERTVIAARIKQKYNLFPHCVGFIDGTLFPLKTRPETVDAPDYSGRKFAYSLSTLIVNDDRKKIIYYLSGWPGSAHDNRIFKKTKLFRNPADFFAEKQYIIGDCAFENNWFVVTPFRKNPNMSVNDARKTANYNTAIGKTRITAEHTIGMLKGRFPWLRQIPNIIKEDVRTLKTILEYIDACVILHNLLIEQQVGDNPEEWADDDDYLPDILDDPNDELNRAVPVGSQPGERRRQLVDYLDEFYV